MSQIRQRRVVVGASFEGGVLVGRGVMDAAGLCGGERLAGWTLGDGEDV